MSADAASSLERGLPEERAEILVTRSLLQEFEAVSSGEPDAEPLVARKRLRVPRGIGGRGCSVVAAALAAGGLLAAALAASAHLGAEPKSPRGAAASALVLQGRQERPPQDGCFDAAAGDGCFEHVAWAKEHGIFQHPEWYPELTPSASAGSFQRVLFENGAGGCGRPCDETAVSQLAGGGESAPGGSSTDPSSRKVDSHLRHVAGAARSSKKKALEASKKRRSSPRAGPPEPRSEEGGPASGASASPAPAPAESREKPELSEDEGADGAREGCHDASPGEQCFAQIQWARQTGVVSNPEWYPGLDAGSPAQDFQAYFNSLSRDGCREPCATSHWSGLLADSAGTAGSRDGQTREVFDLDANRSGPARSDGQTREVQARIAAGFDGGPALFCWMLFAAHSYEAGLVQLQLTKGYNIFACDAYALFTDFPTTLSDGTETTPLGSIESPPSAWGSVLNTEPFVKAWAVIVEDGSFRDYDWTVKADADAVFFPDRLRVKLASVPKRKPYWVQNSNGNTPLIGPLEVFSKEAMELYAEKGKSCARPDVMLVTGEDGFISMCMREIGAESWTDLSQIGWTRDPAVCKAQWNVAYHPFKDVGTYIACEFAITGQQY